MTKRKRRILLLLGAVFFLLVAVRVALPSVLLRTLNEKLAKLEGPLCAHIGDLDLSLIRGRYILEDLTVSRWNGNRSKCESVVLDVQTMHVALSWSQLLKGRARLNVEARYVDLFADDLMNAVKNHKSGVAGKDAANQSKEAASVLVPWRIDSLALSEGKIQYALLGTNDSAVTFEHAEGMITGIEQSRQTSTPTMFRLKGNVMNSARLLVTGSVNMGGKNPAWDVDYGVERVNLTQANPLLMNRAPISFTHGLMDVFGEAAGSGASMTGYAKLLFRDVDVVARDESFKNLKHGLVEILGSLFFIVAENPKRQTAGTIINFGTEGGQFKTDIAGTISSALDHRSGKRLVLPGIENRLTLPALENQTKNPARADAGPERSL